MNDLFRFADKAIRQSEDCFENKLFCAQMMSTHTCAIDSKYGYLDGAKDCLESYKPIEELEEYINEFEASQDRLDEYDLELCKAQQLNPFIRDAYLVKYGQQPAQIIVGRMYL